MIQRAEADLIGHGYHVTWPLTTSTELFDHYCAVVDTGVPFTTTLTGDPAVGVTGTFEVAVTQLNGGCAFVVTDITARLRTERELAAAHPAVRERGEKLERSNRELRVYASAISHDLREPLRTVAGFVDLIRTRYTADLPAEARELFDYVISGTQRMDQRITAILDYARAGAAAAPPHPVDTAQVAAAAARDVSKVLDEAGVRLRIGELPIVDADDVQLQRVFQNLLTNAAVYHRRTVTPRIEISARHLDGHWEFTVADNGPGVQGGARDSIFRMFQRGPDADVVSASSSVAVSTSHR